MYRWSHNTFKANMVETVGVDYTTQNLVLLDDHVSVQVWDTAGQARFHTITKAYYKGSQAIILIYDVNDKRTFENISYWLSNIAKHAPNSTVTLVGNKVDREGRIVSEQEGQEEAEEKGAQYYETSAKTGQCVGELFLRTAEEAYEKIKAANEEKLGMVNRNTNSTSDLTIGEEKEDGSSDDSNGTNNKKKKKKKKKSGYQSPPKIDTSIGGSQSPNVTKSPTGATIKGSNDSSSNNGKKKKDQDKKCNIS